MYKLVAAILLGNGVGGRMATAPHYNMNTEDPLAPQERLHYMTQLTSKFLNKYTQLKR